MKSSTWRAASRAFIGSVKKYPMSWTLPQFQGGALQGSPFLFQHFSGPHLSILIRKGLTHHFSGEQRDTWTDGGGGGGRGSLP